MSEALSKVRCNALDYIIRFERRGFDVTGHGGHDDRLYASTVALAKPGSPHVVKVGLNPMSDPWPHYAAWCFSQPGSFKPSVRSLRWYGQGMSRFFVATMDRLYAPLTSFYRPPQSDEEFDILTRGADTAARLNTVVLQWYADNITANLPPSMFSGRADCTPLTALFATRCEAEGLTDLATFLRTLAAAFPCYVLDPAPQNWFFKVDGQLVMLDPFTRILADIPQTASRLTL